MGQYYKPISLDKKQYMSPHDYGNGLKLMEHSYIGNAFLMAVENLLCEGGDWYMNHIVWAGDYADTERERFGKGEMVNLYDLIGGNDENNIIPTSEPHSKEYRYLANHDKCEFVDLNTIQPVQDAWAQDKGYTWRIHPLSLLTCEGNGRGMGDFKGEDERIGSWARDSISLEPKKPEGYREIDGTFVENS